MPAGKQRLSEMMLYSLSHGENNAIEHFGLKPETWSRAKREFKKYFGDGFESFIKLKEQFTDEEIKALSTGVRPNPHNTAVHSFSGENIRIGVMSDNHLGSIYSDPKLTLEAINEFDKQEVSFVVHSGDITEGMMGRPGDIYELTHIGYKAQRQLAIETLKSLEAPLYLITGNHDCLDPETECLTRRGWKKFTDIRKDDSILSYDVDKDMAVWDRIESILVKDYKGDLLLNEGRRYNFKGTPTHRILHRKAYSYNIKGGMDGYKGWEYEEASKIRGGLQVRVGASLQNEEYPISDDMLRIVAWLQTDGYIGRAKETHTGSYEIYQSKDISGILEIAERLGFSYTLSERQRTTENVCGKVLKKKPLSEKKIRFHSQSAAKIKEFIYDKKTVPAWLYKISDRQFDIYLEVVKQANGSCHKNGKAFAVYGRKEFLDELQILCIIHNKRASISYDNRGCPLLSIVPDRGTLQLSKLKYTHAPYEGLVWCLSVPKTNFMVRRKGKAYFTGNCSYNSKHGVGANIGEDICAALPGATYLGHDEGDIEVGGIRIRLFHGGDGAAYGISYRGQKLIEAISGGTKPALLIAGHTHKSLYMPAYRNVHYIEAGTLQWQSSWMRGKKLAAHVGFWILNLVVGGKEIKSCQATWYPFYK